MRVEGPCARPELGPARDTLEHGGRGIYSAAALWRLLDDPRAQRLADFVARRMPPPGPHVLEPADVEELVPLLDGVRDAVRGSITDDDMVVREDALARVLEWSPRRVYADERGGRTVYTLDEPVHEAADAARFLRAALAGGCRVVVD